MLFLLNQFCRSFILTRFIIDIVVRIPKAAILSTKSCFLSQDITSAPYGHAAHLALALALYGEILRGQDSKWFGYLQSLPRETVDTAIFWGAKDVIDFRSCVCSSRGGTIPSHSANGDDAGNVGAACSNTEFPECVPCLQYLDSKRARMWLSCTEAEKELDGVMVSTLYPYVLICALCRGRFSSFRKLVYSLFFCSTFRVCFFFN
ncbi:hypothetical protein BDR06DRAFT_952509 [Suillus hirtellus]|nr:hypothetical protein BDR06DRAFT_952509 [Suillus hirtellus]